jgi:hypothetical protein
VGKGNLALEQNERKKTPQREIATIELKKKERMIKNTGSKQTRRKNKKNRPPK